MSRDKQKTHMNFSDTGIKRTIALEDKRGLSVNLTLDDLDIEVETETQNAVTSFDGTLSMQPPRMTTVHVRAGVDTSTLQSMAQSQPVSPQQPTPITVYLQDGSVALDTTVTGPLHTAYVLDDTVVRRTNPENTRPYDAYRMDTFDLQRDQPMSRSVIERIPVPGIRDAYGNVDYVPREHVLAVIDAMLEQGVVCHPSFGPTSVQPKKKQPKVMKRPVIGEGSK